MTTIKKILSGDIFRNNFLRKNIRYLFLIFILSFLFVLNGAYGDFKMAEEQDLKKEIISLKATSVYLAAELMQLSLVNEVYNEVKERKIGLSKLSKPPMIIKIETEEQK